MLLFEKAKECPSCWERTRYFSEPTMCARHKEAEFDPAWTAVDRSMAVPAAVRFFCGPCHREIPRAEWPHACPGWREADARLASMHGYEPAAVAMSRLDAATARLEAAFARLEQALKAGAIGAWGHHGRD